MSAKPTTPRPGGPLVEDSDELEEMDERMVPLAQAIGQVILGAAGLEKLLLVEIVQRLANSSGLTDELAQQVSRLERRPAGPLLKSLRGLGFSDTLAADVDEVVERRNELVHRFLERPDVFEALSNGEGIEGVVESVQELARDINRLMNKIGPNAFGGAEEALGASLSEMFTTLRSIEPNVVEDGRLRRQIEMARLIDPASLKF